MQGSVTAVLVNFASGGKGKHTCHKLWTEICEVLPIFKGDLIKFCEILTKISLKVYQNNQKPLFKGQLYISTVVKSLYLNEQSLW